MISRRKTESASSYNRLLQRLGSWHFGPYASVLHIDLHGVRSLNRNDNPRIADRIIAAIRQAVLDWAGEGGIGGHLWSNEFIAARSIDHGQATLEEAQGLRHLLLSLPLPETTSGWATAVSIGVACAKPGADWEQILRQAALACDLAKRRGVNQVVAYSAAADDSRDRMINIEHIEEFRRLMGSGALTLQPQPILDISGDDARLVKAEFLIRMEKNGVLMPLPPGMIESLERFGVANELDRFSCAYILGWLEQNKLAMQRLKSVSINLSAHSVADGNFMYQLFADVRGAHLPPGTLGFEITETSAVEHLEVASAAIAEFRSLGCGFSLDDFGSGLCSFGYLHSLPVDEVKIDGRFVRQMATDGASRDIVSAINQVAHATGKKTVAEFVDDRRKLEVLRQIGVDYAQGYLFYPAVTSDKLLQLLGLGTPVEA
jgi:EAL domain-containing protein (putative c-di-GMP-specific phosphodiesterase class I)/GGDEF domain-containing protein